MSTDDEVSVSLTSGFAPSFSSFTLRDTTIIAEKAAWHETGLEFAEGFTTLLPYDARSMPFDAVLIATAPHEVERWLERQGTGSDAHPGVIVATASTAMKTLVGAGAPYSLSLDQLVIGDQVVYARWVPRQDTDRVDVVLVEVLDTWLLERHARASCESGEAEAAVMDALLLLEGASQLGMNDQMSSALARARSSEAALVRLRREHAALTQKYESLARSKLGRLTLEYRSWRRSRRQPNA